MNIWIFNNYNMLPEQGGLNRHFFFGKYFKRFGHKPVVFVGSHPHNTNLQLIEGKASYKVYQNEPFPWVLIRTCNYEGSKIKRVFSMFQYYFNACKAAKHFDKPDVILGSSAHPLAALLAIRLGKKYKCKKIVEVRDLWPESIVAYGILKRTNPIVRVLYIFEKWLYAHADALIFTMEGAYDYIIEQGWENDIPREKVHHINNGVDLEVFDYNKEHYQIDDPDLEDPNTFKVVYTGSVRRVNNLGLLLDAAKQVADPKIKFLIWGDGDERAVLEKRKKEESITNVVFKGRVDKKYVPYIVSHADLNFAHNTPSPLFRHGISFNKLFDYFAAGKPVLCDFPCSYNPVLLWKAGISVDDATSHHIAKEIEYFSTMNQADYALFEKNAREAAREYDFKVLTEKLIHVIDQLKP